MSRANPRYRRTNNPAPVIGTSAVVQIVMTGTIEGQNTICNFYYQLPGGAVTFAMLINLVAKFRLSVEPSILAVQSSNYALTGYKAICVTQPTLVPYYLPLGTPLPGSVAGTTAAATVAFVMSKQTALRGQHGRGRCYLAGVPNSSITGSSTNAGAVRTALATVGTNMSAILVDGANNWTPVVPSFTKTLPRVIIGAAAITTVAAQTTLGTVRRRRLGRGK